MTGSGDRRRGVRARLGTPLALLAVLALAPGAPAGEQGGRGEPSLAPFSQATNGIPQGWEPLEFPKIPRHTRYAIVRDDGIPVLRAESDDAASGLIHPVAVDLHEWPVLRWRWKVEHALERGDLTRKDGDDYAARVYVAFQYDAAVLSFGERIAYRAARLIWGDLPARALSYVWATRAERGSFHPSPYTGFAQMVVLRSAGDTAGEWLLEERDVLADYRRAFGGEPPLVAGVAVMTDTDDTGESAVAWYGDLHFAQSLSRRP